MSDSLIKRVNFMKNQKPIVAEILQECKLRKLRCENNIENVMIYYPGGFTVMISRLSHFFQFYIKGFGHNFHIDHIDNVECVAHFFDLIEEYKEKLTSGEIVREFETLPPDEEMEEELDNILQLGGEEEYIVIEVETKTSHIFDNKREVMEFINCSRVGLSQVLNGKRPSIKGYMVKKIA